MLGLVDCSHAAFIDEFKYAIPGMLLEVAWKIQDYRTESAWVMAWGSYLLGLALRKLCVRSWLITLRWRIGTSWSHERDLVG
jgi:hypothetical protein